jgi:hypothetical protein
MKNKRIHLIFLITLTFSTVVIQAQVKEKEKVAVYVAGASDDGFSEVLSTCLKNAFTKSQKYVAVERTDVFLQQLQKEHDYQQSGNVDDKQLAVMGKQFGVRYVCAAKLSKLYNDKFLSISLIDVETTEIVATSKATISNTDINSFVNVAQRAAKEIAGKTIEEELAEQKQKDDEIQKERIEKKKASREKMGWIGAIFMWLLTNLFRSL